MLLPKNLFAYIIPQNAQENTKKLQFSPKYDRIMEEFYIKSPGMLTRQRHH